MKPRNRLVLAPSVWDAQMREDADALARKRDSMMVELLGGSPEEVRERCVIGTTLLSGVTGELRAQAIELGLTAEVFLDPVRRRVWGAVLDGATSSEDLLAMLGEDVPAQCEAHACMAQASIPGDVWRQRARQVVRRWRRLSARKAAHVIATAPGSDEDMRLTAQHGIVDMLEDDTPPQTEGTRSLWDDLQDRHDGVEVKASGVDVDPELRAVLSSLDYGRFHVIGARPKHGKSVVCLQLAWHAAKEGAHVVVLSCEMPVREQQARIASMETGINSASILDRHWRPSQSEMGDLWDARHRLDASRLSIYSPSSELPSLEWARKCLRAAMARHGRVDLVVLDYVQKVAWTDKKLKRDEHVSEVSAWCKNVALQGPAVLAASQVKQLTTSMPTRNDLANSDALLRDADVIMLLHRSQAEMNPAQDRNDERFRGALWVAGSRSGGEGGMRVRLLPEQTRFVGEWGQ